MISNLFIVGCVVIFFLITLYTIFDIVFDIRIIDIKKLFKFLYLSSWSAVFLLITIGTFLFILNGIIHTEFYNNCISDITKNNGLGPFGDYFNGLITPIVSIISIIYIYKAFVQQFRANEMLYNFELKKDVKEDLDWLRDNSSFLKELEQKINESNRDELELFFLTEKAILNKLVYTIIVFQDIFKKTKGNKVDLKYNTEIILISFYLKSYKSIFRDINNYMRNSLEIDLQYFNDLTKNEIVFALKFIDLYDSNIKSIDTENQFIYTINEVKNNIENGNR